MLPLANKRYSCCSCNKVKHMHVGPMVAHSSLLSYLQEQRIEYTQASWHHRTHVSSALAKHICSTHIGLALSARQGTVVMIGAALPAALLSISAPPHLGSALAHSISAPPHSSSCHYRHLQALVLASCNANSIAEFVTSTSSSKTDVDNLR